MKRSSLLQHLRKHGCVLKREGAAHSVWTNLNTGAVEAIPRHIEISNNLVRKICRNLSRARHMSQVVLVIESTTSQTMGSKLASADAPCLCGRAFGFSFNASKSAWLRH